MLTHFQIFLEKSLIFNKFIIIFHLRPTYRVQFGLKYIIKVNRHNNTRHSRKKVVHVLVVKAMYANKKMPRSTNSDIRDFQTICSNLKLCKNYFSNYIFQTITSFRLPMIQKMLSPFWSATKLSSLE